MRLENNNLCEYMTFFFFGKKFINIVSEPQETTLLFLKKFIDASLISGFLEKLLLFVDVILIFFLNILFFFLLCDHEVKSYETLYACYFCSTGFKCEKMHQIWHFLLLKNELANSMSMFCFFGL